MLVCAKRTPRKKIIVRGQFKAQNRVFRGITKLVVDKIHGNYDFDDVVPEMLHTHNIDFITICGFPFYPMGRSFNIQKLKEMIKDNELHILNPKYNRRGSTIVRDWFEFKEDDYYL